MTLYTIYTIGYGNQMPEKLFARIPAGVILVDVREINTSAWHRAYTAPELAGTLGERYWPIPQLGNAGHQPGVWRPRGPAALVDMLLFALAGEIQAGRPLCLLCAELRHGQCHRSLIADAMAGLVEGLQVEHL